MRRTLAAAFALLVVVLGGAGDVLADSPAPRGSRGVVVTFLVAGRETYRIRLTQPGDIATARKLFRGERAPSIPNGRVVPGTGVNRGYSWHIDPRTVEFADATIEVCDGLPSAVAKSSFTSDYYCPWSAVVVAVRRLERRDVP